MKTELNLMLHCGANAVERNDILNVDTPEGTATHVPIPHDRLLDEVTDTLKYHDYRIVNEAHALTADGNRYFGMLQLETQAIDHAIIVGVRNSHDKTFPAAIAAGAGVFVCDNLSFSGEIKIARRHTRYILRDLPRVTHRAVSKLYAFYADQSKQMEGYRQHMLSDDRARALMVEGVKRGVIGCTHLPKVLAEWEAPSHDEFSQPNVWRLFNAVTEVAKQWSPDQVYRRTQLLHGLCNAEVGIAV
jgi:hypothetical protein